MVRLIAFVVLCLVLSRQQHVSAANLPCDKLNLCSGELERANPVECFLCNTLVNEAIDKLSDLDVQKGIQVALDYLCSELPDSYREVCHRVVDAYTLTWVNEIVAWLKKENVCKQIKLCSD